MKMNLIELIMMRWKQNEVLFEIRNEKANGSGQLDFRLIGGGAGGGGGYTSPKYL